MSIIIAIKEKDRIVIGCDSQVSKGHLKYRLDNKNCCKIWALSDCENAIMGACGSLRDAQVVQFESGLIPKLAILEGKIDLRFVVKELVEKIYSVLCNARCVDRVDNGFANTINSEFIFAYKNMAYLISQDLCVTPIKDYLVCGCAEEVAIGVLENNKHLDVEKRISEAISVCAKKDCFVDNNIIIKST